MQAASDVMLGWLRTDGIDGVTRDFYVRQMWDGKGSAIIEAMDPATLAAYGRLCGWTLARAHARSGDPVAISSYLGTSDRFDRSIASFAELYADQNERDYAALRHAVDQGRVAAETGLWLVETREGPLTSAFTRWSAALAHGWQVQCAGSGHRRQMSQDIGDTCRRSSATTPTGWTLAMPLPSSKARLVITALFVDHQTPAEVAARYGVHRAWVYKLKARYEAEGDTALEPRSRRPKTSPTALAPEVVDLIVRLRQGTRARPAWTPARTPSPGTCITTTDTRCPARPSAAP